ncbi:MAG: type II secretion system protein N [Oleispira sp.]|nr:type II secretion system protein N [Oleispira sp.]MBL4881042.1 type II secretion system protein N [Oleispira sp.]
MKAIWSAKGYVLTGIISYAIFVVLTAPLEFLWPKIEPKLGPLPVQIDAITGTIWQGQVHLSAAQIGQVSATWDIKISDLFFGQLSAQITATGDELKLNGRISTDGEQVNITDTEAFMSSRYLQPLLRQGRASLDGDFELTAFNSRLSISDKQVYSAEGRLVFSGGDVSFPIDGKKISAKLPILVGTISKPSDNVDLQIIDTEGNSIGSGYIQPDGWAGLVIRRRLLDLLGQKWPADVGEDAIIFEVSQKIL